VEKEEVKSWIIIYMKGFAMGSADAVPGVSGGTIALITGIYERLINAITSLTPEILFRFLKGLKEKDPKSISQTISEFDGYFLTILLTGIISSLVLLLRLMHYLLQHFPIPTYGFFFGLIAASIAVLLGEITLSSPENKLAAIAGFLTSFTAAGYAATSLGHSLPIIFLSGVISVSAMILPGISGSLVLVILGQYKYISGALTEFTNHTISLLKTGKTKGLIESSPPILVFMLGAVIGLLTLAHTIRKALEKHRELTITFLISLIAGGLRAPIVQARKAAGKTSIIETAPIFLSAALAGAALIYLLDKKAGIMDEG
jgi:putative membrane protein